MVNILITGGCGFIGHHFVEHIINNTNWNIVVIDKLTYASMGFKRFDEDIFSKAIISKRLKVITWDLSCPFSIGLIKELGEINIIVHMAAETHVDNSIKNPIPFVKNNIMSTLHLLEYSRNLKNLRTFFYFSTDEVYGPALGDKLYKEDEMDLKKEATKAKRSNSAVNKNKTKKTTKKVSKKS